MQDDASRCFPPAAAPHVRVVILGSLPGAESLARGQYYGHPRNQFWRLMGGLIGVDLTLLGYTERLESLNAHDIGLWDVVASAVRPGSLDQHMRAIIPNGLRQFVDSLPRLEAVAFNGMTAGRIGRRQIGNWSGQLIDLPSSSPAHTMRFADKARQWRSIAPYIRAS